MIKPAFKQALEGLIVRSGLPACLSRRYRSRSLILAYHNVVPGREKSWGEGALHIPFSVFKQHLQILADICDIVPLYLLLSSPPVARERPRVAITFDDAYRGAVEAVRSTMVSQGLPATVFAAPGLLGHCGFWWDRLAQGLGGVIPENLRGHCLNSCQGKQEAILAWARREGLRLDSVPDFAQPVSEGELLDLAGNPGVAVESHTWSHQNLAALSRPESAEEIASARRWIQERGLGPADTLAYPYGLASDDTREVAENAEHSSALLVSGGWLPSTLSDRDIFALPRLNVPAGLSPAGLRLRLAGLRLP